MVWLDQVTGVEAGNRNIHTLFTIKLRAPATLGARADRLLACPRSDGFVRPFVAQWLGLEQPIAVARTHISKVDRIREVRRSEAPLTPEEFRCLSD